MNIEFTVPGRPQQRGSKRAFTNPKGGRPLMVDDNAKGKPWMAAVASAASEAMQGRTLLEGPLSVTVRFEFKRPQSHFRKLKSGTFLRDDASYWHDKAPDADKLMRAIGDSMTGVVYRDDSQIAHVTLLKRYTDSSECAVVNVESLTNLAAARERE